MIDRPLSPIRAALGLVVLFLWGILGAFPSLAAAHEGEGVLVIESIQGSLPSEVTVTVRLTWENDGHPAEDATLTVTVLDASGSARTPVPMSALDDDGRYAAVVTFDDPGEWTIRVTSVSPVATIEEVYVSAPNSTPPQTSDPSSTEPASSSTVPSPTTASPATTSPSDSSSTSLAAATVPAEPDGDQSSGPALVAGVVVVLVVVAGVAAVVVARRRR